MNTTWMQAILQTIRDFVVIPVYVGIVYIACAISLYAVGALFGVPEFTWMNAVWWMIVIVTCTVVFGGGE